MSREPRRGGRTNAGTVAWRIAVPCAFVVVLIVAMFVGCSSGGSAPSGVSSSGSVLPSYPPDPVSYTRPDVTGGPPSASPANTVSDGGTYTTVSSLAAALPSGVLSETSGGTWTLARAVAISGSTDVSLQGPLTLVIQPGAYLLVEGSGHLALTDMTISSSDPSGQSPSVTTVGRGFIAALGGQLVLKGDAISDLGGLSDYGYGISFDRPASGSGVVDCRITGNYFGVYMSGADGVQVIGNTVSDSIVYGIDPHSGSQHIVIQDNTVTGSGVHGIVLAQGVSYSQVTGNTVHGSGDHGIVIYEGSDHNTVSGNTLTDVFDGIVVTSSSADTVSNNSIAAVRFGIRVDGKGSSGNFIEGNSVSGAMAGVYIDDAATGTQILRNIWAASVRQTVVLADAGPGTLVSPSP